jgi:hypothetical protein
MGEVISVEPRPQLQAGARPTAIVPTDMDSCYRLAKAVCMAGMAPKGLDTPEKAMVAIMHGLEIGLTPMAALQRIAVVNGRPTIWGDGVVGLVRGSGLCEFINEQIHGEGDKRVATCEAKRRGEKSPVVRSFSVQDAKQAGLWGKAGPWQQYPERMLQMRARAFALRDLFADVLGGLYLREELEETTPARPTPPVPPTPVIEHKPVAEPAQRIAPRVPPVPPQSTNAAPPTPPDPRAGKPIPIIEKYREAVAVAKDGDELDAAFKEIIEPHMTNMDREMYEAAMALDDARRGELENAG